MKTMRALGVLLLVLSLAPTTSTLADDAATALPLDLGSEATLQGSCLEQATWLVDPCIADCNLYYGWCLDDCDISPYPGCYQDCRAGRIACYQECWS